MHHNIKYAALALLLMRNYSTFFSALYTVIKENYLVIHVTIQTNIAAMIEKGTWEDTSSILPSNTTTLNGVTVFKVLPTVMYQYVRTY